METAKIAGPISGKRLYQERARAALPLLVRQGHAESPIYYSELAVELGMPNPRNLNFVLGSIGQRPFPSNGARRCHRFSA